MGGLAPGRGEHQRHQRQCAQQQRAGEERRVPSRGGPRPRRETRCSRSWRCGRRRSAPSSPLPARGRGWSRWCTRRWRCPVSPRASRREAGGRRVARRAAPGSAPASTAVVTASRPRQTRIQSRRLPSRSTNGAQRNLRTQGSEAPDASPMPARLMPEAASQTGTVSLKKKYGRPEAKESAPSQLEPGAEPGLGWRGQSQTASRGGDEAEHELPASGAARGPRLPSTVGEEARLGATAVVTGSGTACHSLTRLRRRAGGRPSTPRPPSRSARAARRPRSGRRRR